MAGNFTRGTQEGRCWVRRQRKHEEIAGSDGRRGRRGDGGQLWGVETYADVVVRARVAADGGLGDDV